MRSFIKDKKYLKLFIIAAICLAAALLLTYIPPRAATVPDAIASTLMAAGSYEFSCMIEVDGDAREYFWLKGEMTTERRHIKGRVLGTDLELYYQDNNIYRYDNLDQAWQGHSVVDLAEAAAFYAELEPSAAFMYEELIEIAYLGRDTESGRACYNFAVTPVPSGWIAEFFTDVKYVVAVSRWGNLLHAEIIATLKENPNTTMRAFAVFNEDDGIKIEAPLELVQQ